MNEHRKHREGKQRKSVYIKSDYILDLFHICCRIVRPKDELNSGELVSETWAPLEASVVR